MVDLDPVGNDDVDELKTMIENHFKNTKSTVAKFILDDFENQLKNFVKVFPRDYKKVLLTKKGAAVKV
jgi:glutamate synthase (NADPH/NADH) large chain